MAFLNSVVASSRFGAKQFIKFEDPNGNEVKAISWEDKNMLTKRAANQLGQNDLIQAGMVFNMPKVVADVVDKGGSTHEIQTAFMDFDARQSQGEVPESVFMFFTQENDQDDFSVAAENTSMQKSVFENAIAIYRKFGKELKQLPPFTIRLEKLASRKVLTQLSSGIYDYLPVGIFKVIRGTNENGSPNVLGQFQSPVVHAFNTESKN